MIGKPKGPSLFFLHEPPPTIEKQINPVVAVHSSTPQVQGAEFATDPSRTGQRFVKIVLLH
jgi:hypothetical protein